MQQQTFQPGMSRRELIQWMIASGVVLGTSAYAAPLPGEPILANGYGPDPNLQKDYRPGDVWPLTMTQTLRRTTIALLDMIIPADDHGPGATALKVEDFIDEWISAPYPNQRRDRAVIEDGLAWLDAEASKRHARLFADLSSVQMTAMLDPVADLATAPQPLKEAARFFALFRDLAATGYYNQP